MGILKMKMILRSQSFPKIMVNIGFAVSLLLGSLGYGKDPEICTNMAKQSCGPGSRDETGFTTQIADWKEARDRALKMIEPDFIRAFKIAFQKKGNEEFVTHGIFAFGLQNGRSCGKKKGETDHDISEACYKILSEVASRYSIHKSIFPDQKQLPSGLGDVDIESLSEWRETSQFMEIQNEMTRHFRERLASSVDNEQLKSIFKKIKSLVLDKLEAQDINFEVKKIMLHRIKNVRWNESVCQSQDVSANIDTILKTYSRYDPYTNSYALCPGVTYFNSSEFPAVFTMARDLSVLINPCSIRGAIDAANTPKAQGLIRQFEKEPPFSSALRCLSPPKTYSVIGRLGLTSNEPLDISKICTDRKIEKTLSQRFSDWVGSELLSDYMEKYHNGDRGYNQNQFRVGYANVFRPYCHMSDSDNYQMISERVASSIQVNPLIRSHMGCFEAPVRTYCGRLDRRGNETEMPPARQIK